MSIYASNAVWERSKSTGATRLVMLCLAYHMNDEKRESWPGMATIKKETNVSKSGVERAIEWLVVNKEIEVVGGGLGRGNAYAYRFLIDVSWPDSKAKQDDVPMRKGVKVIPYRVVSRDKKGVTLKRKGVKVKLKGVTLNSLPYRTIKNSQEEQLDTPAPNLVDQHIITFEQATGKKRPRRWNFEQSKDYEIFMSKWYEPMEEMKALANGRTDELVEAAVQEMDKRKLSMATPYSIKTVFCELHRKGNRPSTVKGEAAVDGIDPEVRRAMEEFRAGHGFR